MTYLTKLKQLNPNSEKYFNIYTKIILRAKGRATSKVEALKLLDYVETHHIFPKSLLLKEEHKNKENLVFLTLKEHLICHKILAKIFPNIPQFCRAYFAMFSARNHTQLKPTITSKDIEFFKLRSNQLWVRTGKDNGMFGKSHSTETKEKISLLAKGRKHSDETKEKMSEQRSNSKSYFNGKSHSIETKEKISKSVSIKTNGANNPAAKTYVFFSPLRDEFLITGNFENFCKQNNLALRKMKNSVDNGIIKLPNQRFISIMSQETQNCTGWEVRTISYHISKETNH